MQELMRSLPQEAFVYFGDTSFFYQRDGKYFIKTKDSTGNKKEFLTYTVKRLSKGISLGRRQMVYYSF